MKNRISRILSLTFIAQIIVFPFASGQTDEVAVLTRKTLAGLTLEKKVAQLVCVEISGNYLPDDDPKFKSWMSLAHDHGIGGFVLYGGTPHSVGILLNKLQQASALPILISTDFEREISVTGV